MLQRFRGAHCSSFRGENGPLLRFTALGPQLPNNTWFRHIDRKDFKIESTCAMVHVVTYANGMEVLATGNLKIVDCQVLHVARAPHVDFEVNLIALSAK